jgi:hypothetical protein
LRLRRQPDAADDKHRDDRCDDHRDDGGNVPWRGMAGGSGKMDENED